MPSTKKAQVEVNLSWLKSHKSFLFILGGVWSLSVNLELAHAEGTAQLGVSQPLRAGTVLGVDIVDASQESIRWVGRGNLTVYSPGWQELATLASGESFAPSAGNGAYKLIVRREQLSGSVWDVAVQNQVDDLGRLFSNDWWFNAGTFAEAGATDASFFALVPSGGPSDLSVIELKLAGLAGYIYDINANSRGVDGPLAGRSVPESNHQATPEYPIYLRVPSLANFESSTPVVSSLSYIGGVSEDVSGASISPCNQILAGESRGYFSFESNVASSYHLQCDLDADGNFDIASGADLLLIGEASEGENVVAWDGVHNDVAVEPGSYACRVQLALGEFHYVGRDIETSYPGLRIFRVNANGSRSALPMYWNDSLVQSNDTLMINGESGREKSEGEVLPGEYEDDVVPNVNARSWGDFTGAGKGNRSLLDTFVWLEEDTSSLIELSVSDGADADGDGLTDYEESCLVGSDPEAADTDGDGTPDNVQYAIPQSSEFSGLESNGRMATALARRAIQRSRMSVGPVGTKRQDLVEESVLDTWISEPVDGAQPLRNTPTDLLSLTNASTISGADYTTESGVRRGGVLLVSADGEFYEHQKHVCDRVHGAKLLDVTEIDFHGVPVFQSTLSDVENGRLEHGASLHLWEDDESAGWRPVVFWVSEDAPVVPKDASVVTIQAWGDSPGFAVKVLESVLDSISEKHAVIWPNQPKLVDDEEYEPLELVAQGQSLSEDQGIPRVIVQRGSTLDGKIGLTLRRLRGAGPVTIQFSALDEQLQAFEREQKDRIVGAEPEHVEFDIGPVLETTVDIVQQGKVVDRVWLSDGSWAPIDESVWEGEASGASFSKTDCTPRSVTDSELPIIRDNLSEGDIALAGCAKADFKELNGASGVARHLTTSIDVSKHTSLVYYVQTALSYEVCAELDLVERCVNMQARKDGAWEAIPFSAFGGGTDLKLVSFVRSSEAFAVEVAGLTLMKETAPDTRTGAESGCSFIVASPSSSHSGGLWFLISALLLFARRPARCGELS